MVLFRDFSTKRNKTFHDTFGSFLIKEKNNKKAHNPCLQMLYLLNHLCIKVVYEWLMVTRDQQCESRKKISYHTKTRKGNLWNIFWRNRKRSKAIWSIKHATVSQFVQLLNVLLLQWGEYPFCNNNNFQIFMLIIKRVPLPPTKTYFYFYSVQPPTTKIHQNV